jgi:hypothetical protein
VPWKIIASFGLGNGPPSVCGVVDGRCLSEENGTETIGTHEDFYKIVLSTVIVGGQD